MNNFDKWISENVTPEIVWMFTTGGDIEEPCNKCPASEYCKTSSECCYKSFESWAKGTNQNG